MKTKAKLTILALMCLLAAASVWGAVSSVRRGGDAIPAEVYAQYHAKGGRASFLLREEDGHIAVYRSGESRAELLTDIETAQLRRADRAMLVRGIPVENREELLELLEDFGS